MERFITIKDTDEEGKLRPACGIWRDDENLKYHQPEIDKYMKNAKKEGIKLVKVELVELED